MSKQADGGRDGSDGVDLAIESLCIFSTELGQQEGREKDKVLFYYPTETDVYRQTRNAGLAAAMVGFTGQFSPEQPVEAVVTQKTIQSFYCCEAGCRVPHSQVPGKRPSVWLVLTVRKGAALRPAAGGSSSSKGKAAAPLPPETEGGGRTTVCCACTSWRAFAGRPSPCSTAAPRASSSARARWWTRRSPRQTSRRASTAGRRCGRRWAASCLPTSLVCDSVACSAVTINARPPQTCSPPLVVSTSLRSTSSPTCESR
eukprot:COSAG01_NODE_2175_length_8221_cov_34.993722_8_plen_258_part_00